MFGCELLKIKVLIYVLSLAFQVAGAVLLILKYFGKTEERIIDEYFPGSNFIQRDDNENVLLEKAKVQECARKIYDNRMSFAYIAIGYVLSIFGELSGECKICVLFFIVFCTLILILLERIISILFSKLFYRKDIEKKYDQIKDKADTVITNKEIEEIFQEVFEDEGK